MLRSPKSLIAILLMISCSCGHSASILNYEGRVSVAGKPFTGRGHFIFLIVDGTGDALWSSGPFPLQKTTNLPPGVITLGVTNGTYSVQLGDTNGMPALEPEILANAFAPKLRIWFNDGSHGWEHAGEEVSLATVLGSGGEASGAAGETLATTAILRELKQLKMLMLDRPRTGFPSPQTQTPQKPAEPARATVALGDGPALGRADAPLVLVEFTDYQCPFCKRFTDTVMPELVKTYVETGKLRIISRNLALPIHPNAESAAMAALCAQQQEQFWNMRGLLFTNSANLTPTNLIRLAESLKLDCQAFGECLNKKLFAEQIKKDNTDASSAGITGTPTFVLGKPENGKVSGPLIVGARPFSVFDSEIKKVLAGSQ